MKKIKYLLFTLLLVPISVFATDKEETIFSNLDYTGKVKNVKVTNHLKINETKTLEDNSSLKEILNISGDEKFKNDNGLLKWETKGEDIVYKGTTTKALPITTKITYYLDGKEIELKELLGKKGHIDIKLDFTNETNNSVNVNGKEENIHTPFVTTVGAMFNTSDKNIEVTNGKVVSNGTSKVLLAIATPGLYESTGINTFKNMDSITISYDTKKFKLNNIYIVSIPKILEKTDLDIFDKLDSLTSNMNKLKNGMDQIISGSNELKTRLGNSLGIFNDKTDALTIDQIEEIKNTTLATIEEQSEVISNTAWEQTKEGLLNSDDQTVANYTQTAAQNILLAYFGTPEKLGLAVRCATEYQTLKEAAFSEGQNCTMYIQSENGDVNKVIKDLKFIETINTELTNLSTNTTFYVAENVSRGVSVETSKSTAESVSETLSPQVANQVKFTIMDIMKQNMQELYNGVSQLDSGLNKFSSEGITPLYNYSNTINNYKSTFEALKELSNNYQGFTSDNSSKVIFISKVESK